MNDWERNKSDKRKFLLGIRNEKNNWKRAIITWFINSIAIIISIIALIISIIK